MRNFLTSVAVSFFLAGCASPPGNPQASASGLKEYTFEVRQSSVLTESVSQGRTVEFKARCVFQSSDGSTVQLELEPAYGGHGDASFGPDDKNGATQRLTPVISGGGSLISVTSQKLKGIPLGSLRYLVTEVAATGSEKGNVIGLYFAVSGEDLVKCTKTSTGKYQTTFRQGGSTFSITFNQLQGFTDGDGKPRHNDPQWWSAEVGTLVSLRNNEWFAERIPAGPDGADFSFLETQSTRGEFD